ncbi:MAG TPA: Sec-independent protein translocase protein TatB [Methylophilus sp.]|nr:Sec-independent protein translocase protein TatB [Methylophilus sp.]HQQ34296.1 Sec-independent protein translocase protein TatB [Methylophilus sp.]
MFDVSFSELLVIAVVALLVVGPEKLPKVARTAGAIIGRLQRYMVQVKEEVNREARFAELQQLQQEIHQSTQGITRAVEHEIDALEASIHAPSGPSESKAAKSKVVKSKAPDSDATKKKSIKPTARPRSRSKKSIP